MNHIDEYRKRREARLKKRMDEEWVTMRGTHVLIDDEGQVKGGPDSLKKIVNESGGYKKGTKKIIKEDWYVKNARDKMNDNIRRMKDGSGHGKMWRELESDIDLCPDGTKVTVDGKVYERGLDDFGEGGWIVKDKSGQRFNKTSAELVGKIGAAIRGGKGNSVSIEDGTSTMEGDFAAEGYQKNKEGRWEKKSGDAPHKPVTTIPSTKRMAEYEKEDKTIKDRPKSPIKPNFKRCNKVVDDVFSKMGAEFWEKSTPDTDVWEFPNKVSAKKAATALVNSLREKGYDAVFTTASGMWSEKPTGFIWVKNPKNDYHGVQYSIYKSSDEPGVGKTHLSIDKIETF